MLYDLKFVFDMPYDRNEYADTSCPDAPIPPHFPIPRCNHHKEAHVKQSGHPSTVARAYYCCPYKSVINNTLHVWILFNLTLTSSFSCPSKIGVDSFNGLMEPRRWIHKFFFSRMIGMSLLRCCLSGIWFLCHQIHRQWQMRRRTKQVPAVSATCLHVNVATVLSWWTRLTGWITHRFFIVWFLYW
jgi:hypothetical protein